MMENEAILEKFTDEIVCCGQPIRRGPPWRCRSCGCSINHIYPVTISDVDNSDLLVVERVGLGLEWRYRKRVIKSKRAKRRAIRDTMTRLHAFQAHANAVISGDLDSVGDMLNKLLKWEDENLLPRGG